MLYLHTDAAWPHLNYDQVIEYFASICILFLFIVCRWSMHTKLAPLGTCHKEFMEFFRIIVQMRRVRERGRVWMEKRACSINNKILNEDCRKKCSYTQPQMCPQATFTKKLINFPSNSISTSESIGIVVCEV